MTTVTTAKIEKVEAGQYTYRGVNIFKYDNAGFSYYHSIRTDRYCRSDASYPVTLKTITSKIDAILDDANTFVECGKIVRDIRTAKAGA